MKTKKCIICSEVKGRRACSKTNNELICPRCCAKTRNDKCQGCIYFAQAEKFNAEKSMKKHFIMRIDPEVDKSVDRALGLVEKGKLLAGEAIITDLIKEHPDICYVQYAMGVVCALKSKYDESIVYFDKALEIFPYHIESWFNKALSHQKKFEIDEMVRAYQKVIEFGDPGDNVVRQARDIIRGFEQNVRESSGISLDDFLRANEKFNRAFSEMENKQWEKALAGFKEVIKIHPTHTQSFGNMGLCYGMLGMKKEAFNAYDRALELDPNYEPAILNRTTLESLPEGATLTDDHFKSMDYYKDYSRGKKSLLDQFSKKF